MDYTLTISENNKKSLALINYLKTLDFIHISKATDWWENLSFKDKELVQKGLDDLENKNTHSDEEVRKSIRQRIINVEKK